MLIHYIYYGYGMIYLIYLVYRIFFPEEVNNEEIAINPIASMKKEINKPIFLFQTIILPWFIIGFFTPIWYAYLLFLLVRLSSVFIVLNDRDEKIYDRIRLVIEILIITYIIVHGF